MFSSYFVCLFASFSFSSFENLRTGLKELERRVSNQQEGPTTFLKSNVYAIVKCLDVLKELNKVMNKDRTEMGSALTENVAQHLKGKLMVVVVFYVSFLSVSACV